MALALRFDYHLALKRTGLPLLPSSRFSTPFYRAQLLAYIAALVVTVLAVHLFQHPQPALLWIVPSCSVAAWLCAYARGELREFWSWVEQDETAEADGKKSKEGNKSE
jgi:minor histocompatibility antigen H13